MQAQAGDPLAAHAARRARLVATLQSAGEAPLGLAHGTSNLFRDRAEQPKHRIDLRDFRQVLALDVAAGWVDVEGSTRYEDLVAATLPRGVMPAVVPQLKTITVGGAAAGVGIEATSFRHGLVHDTLLEFDVLLPDGRIVTCTPGNEHRDLYFGFPNSYGTLGYAIRLRQRTLPVRANVRVEHRRHADPRGFFDDLARQCEESAADFVDGVVFGPRELVLSVARFVDDAPWLSDYTFRNIYYRSLRSRETDYLSAHDYLWRWDTDWFWCSQNLFAQNPVVRRLLGRGRLNSVFYTRVMRWNSRVGLTRWLDRIAGRHPESVIQDVDIPVERAPEFLDFFLREVGIRPLWVCPFRAPGPAARWPLFPTRADALYVNFGFWDVVRSRAPHPAGHFNRMIERKVVALGGIKSLYSDSYFPRAEFDAIYGGAAYAALKARYDPDGRLPGLYEKCVLRR